VLALSQGDTALVPCCPRISTPYPQGCISGLGAAGSGRGSRGGEEAGGGALHEGRGGGAVRGGGKGCACQWQRGCRLPLSALTSIILGVALGAALSFQSAKVPPTATAARLSALPASSAAPARRQARARPRLNGSVAHPWAASAREVKKAQGGSESEEERFVVVRVRGRVLQSEGCWGSSAGE